MGKRSGLGQGFWVDGYDISGDIGSLSRVNSSRNVTEVTGIDVEAFERLHTHRDGGLEYSAWFNDAIGQSHPVHKLVPATDRIVTYLTRKATIATSAAACVGKQLDYAGSRPNDASVSFAVTVESNGYGLEWGQLLTAGKRTDTGATNGAAVDMEGASFAFGLQAYLHVFSFTGTDATIKLQMDDNTNFTSATDVVGGGFTQITAGPQAQRIQTGRTATVERYLRAVTTTTGGFSEMTFGVVVVKNTILTNF
jgi:hypothetical protein